VGEEAAQQFPNCVMAREGLSIQLIPPSEDHNNAGSDSSSVKEAKVSA
jgi:hypothetical protein